jgi:chemotaxis response regulator CheB
LRNAKEQIGLLLPKKEQAQAAEKILQEMDFEPQDWDDVAEAVSALDKITNPLGQIRQYLKKHNMKMPAKVRKLPFKQRAENWMVRNAYEGSVEDFRGWLTREGTTEKQQKRYLEVFELIKRAVKS